MVDPSGVVLRVAGAADHVSMVVQPSGTVTLVVTDVEGSTRLLRQLGRDRYQAALAEHREVVRAAGFARSATRQIDRPEHAR
jgi:class 3 adenylate cyclase